MLLSWKNIVHSFFFTTTRDKNMKVYVHALIYILAFIAVTVCERTSTWDSCKCRWETWKPWSSCTASCAGGRQERSRRVWTICDEFTDCATTGWDYQDCNQVCYNQGTYSSYGCLCRSGWEGSCCEQEVTCGSPSSISHGSYSGYRSTYTYNSQVVYQCEYGYNMTNPSAAVRTCTGSGYWTGYLPTCEYAVSCNSYPCKNGANCVNLLGGYRCECRSGWSGRNCEVDIQLPVVSNCPEDKKVHTANMTYTIVWQEPTFADPHGKQVVVSKNYQNSSFDFPWGVFTVQYTAVKPTNGLTSSCLFTVSIKPNPCVDLTTPAHGIKICNGWMRDYTRVCKLLCLTGYTYPPGFKSSDWYTCGSSGNWLPAEPLLECLSDDVTVPATDPETIRTFANCNRTAIAQFYIESLRTSQFNSICEEYPSDCKPTNLDITCN